MTGALPQPADRPGGDQPARGTLYGQAEWLRQSSAS